MAIAKAPRIDLAKDDVSVMPYPHDALLSNRSLDWNGLYIQYHRQPPHEMAEHSYKQHRIIVHDQTLRSPMSTVIEDLTQPVQIAPGTITVIPANARNWARWNAEHQFVLIAFETDRLEQLIAETTIANKVELLPTLGQPNALIYNIGLALKAELESHESGQRLYIDALITALVAHLLRHFSVQKLVFPVVENGLSKRKLQQVTDYIHAHLEQDLTLAELAAVVHTSPSYFSSLFKQSMSLAPHQYVIQCRVEKAKQLLLRGEMSIAEIAQILGFSHQSHLNRHFKRLVGVTPKAFLKSQ